MNKVRVGVLRGGPSHEYDVSIETGASILENLDKEKYNPLDVFIDKEGKWHLVGAPIDMDRLSGKIDVALIALHGHYGEDGQVQRELERFGVPYTGSGVASSALAMHKERSKKAFKGLGVKTPGHTVVERGGDLEKDALEIFRNQPIPHVSKPVNSGSSLGITISNDYEGLREGVEEALRHSSKALVEECITGREATCGVINNFRGEELYALPPIEIIPPKGGTFFDYDAKYGGESQEICPGNFTREEKEEMQDIAKRVHKGLGLRHYSRTDFIISPRGIYVLEVNTLPGLSPESLLPKALEAVGTSFAQFLDHLVQQALES